MIKNNDGKWFEKNVLFVFPHSNTHLTLIHVNNMPQLANNMFGHALN